MKEFVSDRGAGPTIVAELRVSVEGRGGGLAPLGLEDLLLDGLAADQDAIRDIPYHYSVSGLGGSLAR